MAHKRYPTRWHVRHRNQADEKPRPPSWQRRNRHIVPILIDQRTQEAEQASLASQVGSWGRAEWSYWREGPVSREVFDQRCQQCVCRKVDESDGQPYCGCCGCGSAERAKFGVKMKMPAYACEKCGIESSPGIGREHRDESTSQQLIAVGGRISAWAASRMKRG